MAKVEKRNCRYCGQELAESDIQFCSKCGAGISKKKNLIAFEGYTRNVIFVLLLLVPCTIGSGFLFYFNEKAKRYIREGNYEKFREYESKAKTAAWVSLCGVVALIMMPFMLVVVAWFMR